MRVSVFLPYYNDEVFLKDCIESILNQSFEDFELILFNHSSTDNSREIAHSYKDSRIIHIDGEKNYGAGTGLNLINSLKYIKGDYVKLFCADDVMYPNCLQDLVAYMDENSNVDFAFGDVDCLDKNGTPLNFGGFKDIPSFSLKNTEIDCLRILFKLDILFPFSGFFIKTDILKKVRIDTTLMVLFDVSLWISILIKGYKIGYLNKYIAGYRIHDEQLCCKKNANLNSWRVNFEASKIHELFYQIDSLDMLKKLFPKNPYINKIDILTKEDVKFIIAFESLTSRVHSGYARTTGYSYFYECFNDKDRHEYINKRFGFDIENFREIYSKGHTSNFQYAKNLTLTQLAYLFLKKLFLKITLK